MKKRLLLLLFIFGFFFYMPNVFADEFYVCNGDCDFRTLDEALSAAEEYSADDSTVYIYVSGGGNFTISDHNLQVYVDIEINDGDLIIDGQGSTIYLENGLYMEDDDWNYNNLELKNVDFVTDHEDWLLDIEGFKKADISNISLKILHPENSDYPVTYGMYFCEQNTTLDSVVIEGFGFAVYPDESYTVIKNSSLDKNVFSLYIEDCSVKTENTSLSYIINYGNNSVKIDSIGDRKIVYDESPGCYDPDSCDSWSIWFSNIDRLYDNGDSDDYLRIYNMLQHNGFPSIISGYLKKSITLTTTSLDLLDVLFDGDFELSDFDIDISNDEVVSIENGMVKALMNGNSTITLTDKETEMEYYLKITVNAFETPKTNPKTKNSLIIVGITLLFMISSLGTMIFKKQH